MKKLTIILPLFIQSYSIGQTPDVDPHYKLVWSDEFDGTEINDDIWQTKDWVDHNAGNEDFYSPETSKPSITLANNVEVSGGTLKLHFKRETVICGTDYNAEWGYEVNNLENDYYCTFQQAYGIPYEFSGAQVQTKPAYQNSYGYYEARVRMPYKFGVHNAFWTFRGTGETGNAAEIDIFETVGRIANPDIIKTNVHLDYCDDDSDPTGFALDRTKDDHFCGSTGYGDLCAGIPTRDYNACTSNYEGWHVYGLELTPSHIIWYIDGVPVRYLVNPGVHSNMWVRFGIVSDPNYYSTDPTNFNVIHEVDYFRFYELDMDCATEINVCSFWFGGHDNKVKDRIEIGNGGCSNIQPIGSSIILRAKEEVIINGNFEVPLGAELYMDANNCY